MKAILSLAAAGLIAAASLASSSVFPSERPRTLQATAERIARAAVLNLRAETNPTEQDYRIAALTFGLALDLEPTNQEYLRRQIRAWRQAADEARELQATQRLLTLDPADTVSQLRLITGQIAAVHEAEQRLAIYDRLLGPQGQSLDPAIRSRLALDAALLARERGDEDLFTQRLAQATELDSSHKEAAVLAAAYVLERTDDPLARVEMLLNVLMADPTDPSAHLNLARELRSRGAFTASARFQINAETLLQRFPGRETVDTLIEAFVSRWQSEGTEELLRGIAEFENIGRENRRREINFLESAGQPSGPPLEEFRIPTEVETFRLAANLALGRQAAAESSLNNLIVQARIVLDTLANPPEGAEPLTPEQRASIEQRVETDTLWWRLWTGAQIDDAEEQLNRLAQSPDLRKAAQDRYRGWIALRRGDLPAARALLEPLAPTDPQARLGMGALAEAEGNARAAAAHYAVVALRQPETLLGAFARFRVETLLQQPVNFGAGAADLDAYIRRAPPWLDDMARNPASFTFLALAPVTPAASVLDGTFLTLTLRNTSRLPLALGPVASPISSRLLLTPGVNVQGRGERGEARHPEIIELDHRLRLMPGEALNTIVWASQGLVGDLLDTLSVACTVRWRGALGFAVDTSGRLVPSPVSATADAGIMTRYAVESLSATPEGVATALTRTQGDALLESFFFSRSVSALAQINPKDTVTNELAANLVKAIASSMPTMSPTERALAAMVVTTIQPPGQFGAVDEAAAADPSPFVRLVWLAAMRPPPDKGPYDDLAANANPDWSELARLLRDKAIAKAAAQQAQAPAPAK